mmetsp:Transcript_104165/g.293764  ORF Transcript_104165/g.293764 Transcript_104165/m.293764 type:complete len:213 (+) Transcript_104165:364-1002(+)
MLAGKLVVTKIADLAAVTLKKNGVQTLPDSSQCKNFSCRDGYNGLLLDHYDGASINALQRKPRHRRSSASPRPTIRPHVRNELPQVLPPAGCAPTCVRTCSNKSHVARSMSLTKFTGSGRLSSCGCSGSGPSPSSSRHSCQCKGALGSSRSDSDSGGTTSMALSMPALVVLQLSEPTRISMWQLRLLLGTPAASKVPDVELGRCAKAGANAS